MICRFQNVTFERNVCVQDGTISPSWTSFYRQCNPSLVGSGSLVTVTIVNNTFSYTNASGVGTVGKDTGKEFVFVNNTLIDTVLNFDVNYVSDTTEVAEIVNNTLRFTRVVPPNGGGTFGVGGVATAAALLVGGATATVSGNTVVSAEPQSASVAAIAVRQTGYNASGWPRRNGALGNEVVTVVIGNAVEGFDTSIQVRRPTIYCAAVQPSITLLSNRALHMHLTVPFNCPYPSCTRVPFTLL
jgi:hypothetical protein